MKNRVITVKGTEVAVARRHEQDYVSLTGTDFKSLEFEGFRTQAGLNSIALFPGKCIEPVRRKVRAAHNALLCRQAGGSNGRD